MTMRWSVGVFQANTRVITASDTLLGDLVNIIR